MTAKLHVLRLYVEEVKSERRLTILCFGLAIVTSVVLGVIPPIMIAIMLAKILQHESFWVYAVVAISSYAVGARLMPLRHRTRRLLQIHGHDNLVRKFEKTIHDAP